MENFRELAKKTKFASIKLGGLSGNIKNTVLENVAQILEKNAEEIFTANKNTILF